MNEKKISSSSAITIIRVLLNSGCSCFEGYTCTMCKARGEMKALYPREYERTAKRVAERFAKMKAWAEKEV